jgi:virginiamycin B lyase
MRTRISLLLGVAAFCVAGTPALAQAPALTGQVTSAKEGAMEGVLVTAKRQGSAMSTTVVSDARGRFAFPQGRLEPGNYRLTIRAIGYVLDGPRAIEVKAGGSAADVKLREISDISAQLTNSEWLMSAPGTMEEKRDLMSCATCHVLNLPMMSNYTAQQIKEDLIPRMADMSSQAMPTLIQKRVVRRNANRTFGNLDRLANYLASVNLSAAREHKFQYKTFDRPKGENTRVIITSYDLPRKTMQPHDAVMGDDGYVWISNFGENSIQRLDPKSGQVKEYTYAQTRPGPYSNGNLDIEFDKQGLIWIGMMNQTGISSFDRKTETFTHYPIPREMLDDETQTAMVAPINSHVDGKIWINSAEKPRVARFDRASGRFEGWTEPFTSMQGGHSAYGTYTDSQNNLYLNDFPSQYVWRIDAKTGEVKSFKVPTDMARPRRGRMDSQDRLWFAEWWGNKVAMFDTKSAEFMEWEVPGYFPAPYDAELDKTGWVWTNNMMDDRVTRINASTGQTVQYLMPIETNARRVSIDNYGQKPVMWIGAQHLAVVMKVEPLD